MHVLQTTITCLLKIVYTFRIKCFYSYRLSLPHGCEAVGHTTHEDNSLVKPGRKLNRGRCFANGGQEDLFSWRIVRWPIFLFVYVSTRSSLVKHFIASHTLCGNTIYSCWLFQMKLCLTLDVSLLWDCLSPRCPVYVSQWRNCGYFESQVRTILDLHCNGRYAFFSRIWLKPQNNMIPRRLMQMTSFSLKYVGQEFCWEYIWD